MFYLNGEVSSRTREIKWEFGGYVWTPAKYYAEGILKISLKLGLFGLSKDRIAALKTFEEVVSQNHIDWIEIHREEWVIDLDGLRRLIKSLANERNADAIPRFDALNGLLAIKPEIEWETDKVVSGQEKVYRAIAALHIFKDSLGAVSRIPLGVWELIHPRIVKVAKSRFESKHFADSVEAALKEINSIVKDKFKKQTNKELDGAKLMREAFSPNNPIIKLSDSATLSGESIQQGYMHLFTGTIIGIRNPKAHENIDIDEKQAIHILFLASLLLYKLDESK